MWRAQYGRPSVVPRRYKRARAVQLPLAVIRQYGLGNSPFSTTAAPVGLTKVLCAVLRAVQAPARKIKHEKPRILSTGKTFGAV